MQAVIKIRPEGPDDHLAVADTLRMTFRAIAHSHHDEHELVEKLRSSPSFIPQLSLVALVDNSIVGYVLFTHANVKEHKLVALAPLGVRPMFQKQGIGTALVRTGHHLAIRMGHFKGAVVLGEPSYFARFGYEPASLFGIYSPRAIRDSNQYSDEYFRICPFAHHSLEGIHGMVEYDPIFYKQ